MRQLLTIAASAAATLIATLASAAAQPADQSGNAGTSPAAAEAEGADRACECLCPKTDEKKKTKVIYVGPRQNIPMEIDRDDD